jgi:hypothetical protein
MEAFGSPKRIKHMETMILAEMEPGSFFWWFVRDFWSVIWTICAIATPCFIVWKILDSRRLRWECPRRGGKRSWCDDDKAELGWGSVAGVVACVIWPLIFSGCGPWLDDEEQADLDATREVERQAEIQQQKFARDVDRRAERARIEAESKAAVERSLAENRTRVLQRLAQFSRSDGARITQIIEQLKAAEEGLRGKIIGLKEVLVDVGNEPEEDQEYRSWGQMLERLIRDRHDLERKLEDAFLASERFRLAPSDAFKTEMTGHISKGNELANKFAGRYRELMQWK